MNRRQWLVLWIGLIPILLVLLTLVQSDYVFTLVHGRPVTLFDSSFLPFPVRLLILIGLLLLTGAGLIRFRTDKPIDVRPDP